MMIRYRFLLLFLLAPVLVAQQTPTQWVTPYERSRFLETPRYLETMTYCNALAKASPWIRVSSFGVTPQGRSLPLVILSKENAFTPEKARASKKPLLLVQSGIHAGEIDGKDASLMLMREIAVTKSLAHLLDHLNILFMPIFNLDGHERFSAYNRINQSGPKEMGWRVTANNLNLNRDYMKADAPEMRAWLKAFHAWKPDMFIDCHVTDGMDFQYDITYSMEMFENSAGPIVAWQKKLEEYFIPKVNGSGHLIAPFIWPREEHDLSKGFLTGVATPRFSTGYVALQNRGAMLIETHVLKNYKARVGATYQLVKAVMEYMNGHPDDVRLAVKEAEKQTILHFSTPDDRTPYPLNFRTPEKNPSTIRFLGYTSETVQSAVSGHAYKRWTKDTMSVDAPFFDKAEPSLRIAPPTLYLIPQEWTSVLDVLRLHDVRLARLTKDVDAPVEMYRFKNAKWRETPYEGRHPVTFSMDTLSINRLFPKGTYAVLLNNARAKTAIHLLEPYAPDSFVQWGFFDAVFEQKEYFESYIMEEIAKQMLERNQTVRNEFQKKVNSDSTFAKNPRARLNFFYERSPYMDREWNLYPVARYLSAVPLPMEDAGASGASKRKQK